MRFLGLRVAAISAISMMVAGSPDKQISHAPAKAVAAAGAAKLKQVRQHFLRNLH